jgi:cytochrome c oxidase assembly factor CtaG
MAVNLGRSTGGAADERVQAVNVNHSPYQWDPHLVGWLVIGVAVIATVVGHRRLADHAAHPVVWRRQQILLFGGACLAAVVALTWPLADLAAHWSLLTLVVQRLLLILAVPSLLLLGLPYDVLRWLTRPAPVDAVLEWVRQFKVAVLVVTVTLLGSMSIPAVEAQASSAVARGLIDLAVVLAGFVLWLPVIGRVPGILRLEPWMRFGYLVVQAVVPAFLSFIYIFARRPLYPTFLHSHLAIDLNPLVDQQISGFASKLSMLLVLLSVGAVVLNRVERRDSEEADDEPLLWADVERQLERVDRREAKGKSGRTQPTGGPAPGPTAPGDP